MTVIERLSKHGDRLVLAIDPAFLAQLQIDENTPLEVSVDGHSLKIAPISDTERKQEFEAALRSTNERFGDALKRLAQ